MLSLPLIAHATVILQLLMLLGRLFDRDAEVAPCSRMLLLVKIGDNVVTASLTECHTVHIEGLVHHIIAVIDPSTNIIVVHDVVHHRLMMGIIVTIALCVARLAPTHLRVLHLAALASSARSQGVMLL